MQGTFRKMVSRWNHKLGLWLCKAILPWCLHQSNSCPGLDCTEPQAVKLQSPLREGEVEGGVFSRDLVH